MITTLVVDPDSDVWAGAVHLADGEQVAEHVMLEHFTPALEFQRRRGGGPIVVFLEEE